MELGKPLKSRPNTHPLLGPSCSSQGVWPHSSQGRGGTLGLRSLGHRQLPTSAPRWPRTLAGITAYQSCLQYPFTSVPLSGGAPGTRASRRCDRAGRWEPGDYSHCLYTNDITRVLYTFVLVRPGEGRGAGKGEGRSLLASWAVLPPWDAW